MIRNRNMIFQHANDDSRDEDQYIRLPKIAKASRPTAAAAINGAVYYDTTDDTVKACVDGSWVDISTASE